VLDGLLLELDVLVGREVPSEEREHVLVLDLEVGLQVIPQLGGQLGRLGPGRRPRLVVGQLTDRPTEVVDHLGEVDVIGIEAGAKC
jgi:hypothetical protein